MKNVITIGVMLLLASLTQHGYAASELIKIDGSSTVFPITEAVSEEFGRAGKGKVMVGISGTGGGFKRFCRGETDISDASRPIKDSEKSLCKSNGIGWIEIPVAYDGLAVVVNPRNYWVDYFTVEELKKIWDSDAQRVITNWNQVRSGFPDKPLRLFGPGTDSGTFDYFTEAINGKSGKSRGDYTASEDDNILVEGVAADEGGLGYFGLAYYEANQDKLKLVPVDDGVSSNGNGPIFPSVETVMEDTYKPLARPIFIYISQASAKKKNVKGFVEFYLENAAPLVEEVGYIPLKDKDYKRHLVNFQGSAL